MEIIALNHVTFREKALPSLRCKLNSFHCHLKLNVHVVADLCQKTPKFFKVIKMAKCIFFGKLLFFSKRQSLQVLALDTFSTFVTTTFEKRLQTGNLFNFHTRKKLIIWYVCCVVIYPCGTFSDKVPEKYLQSCIERSIHYHPDSYRKYVQFNFDLSNKPFAAFQSKLLT